MTTATTTRHDTGIRTDVQTWAELVKAIDEHNGVALIPMETLRKLEGAQRLGVHVLKSIGNRLGTLGLGHMPHELPNRQDQDAVLYRYGTPASEVISAVRTGMISAQEVKNTYHALYKLNTTPDTTDVVHKAELEDTLTTAAKGILGLLGESSRAGLLGGVT